MLEITSSLVRKVKVLYKNPWLELRELSDKDAGISGYIYSHETRCQGQIIAIIPYRKIDGHYEYLLRREITPCWGTNPSISSITGGYEEKLGIHQTAINEIKEEAGYKISDEELIDLGQCFGTKSCDTIYHLFSCDLTDKNRGKASGDGSELETKSDCFWSENLDQVNDAISHAIYYKLQRILD